MKKKYSIIIFLFLSTLYSYGQDCLQRNLSDDIICSGQNATIILSGSVNLQDYQLRIGTTIIETKTGTGANVTFIVTPLANTTYNIIAVGCSSPYIDTATVTVNANVIPIVNILSNTTSTICAGTSVTFTATATNGGTNPSYQWYVGVTAVGTNSATYTTSTLANNNQVRVVMTSNASCPAPITGTSNILTMTVNTSVVPSVIISATQTTFCNGTSVLFSVNTLNNGGINPTYQWRLNGNPIGTNSSSYSTSALANNDVITLDVTSSASCASPLMVSSNAIAVTVNSLLPASVTISSSDADNIICGGTSITFTATPTNGGVAPAYQWYVGATAVGTNSATYTISGLATGQSVRVVMTSNATCPTGNPATSNAIVTTVNPNLPVSVSISSSDADNIICAGTSVTFTVTPTNGGTPSYQWYLGATPIGTNSTTYTTSGLTSGQSVTVVMTSNAVCPTGNPATSNAIATIVNPNLPASVSISSSDADNIICAGTSVTFTATPTNGGTPSYQWYLGPTLVGTNSATYTTSGLTTGQSVTVFMTSTATCTTGSPAISSAIITTVNPNLSVSVSIVSNDADNIICAGTSVTFNATPTNGGTPSYQWYLGPTLVGTNSATYTTSGLTTGQSVTVAMTSTATCATGNPATSNAIITTVNPNLPASVNISSSDVDNIICAGTSVTFTATPSNGGTAPSYQWYLGAALVGTNSVTYTTTGLTTGQSVTVVMTSNATCSTGSPVTSTAIVTTVNTNLPAGVTISSSDSDNIICAGTSVTFTATPTNGGTPAYNWYLGPTLVGTNSTTYTTSGLTTGQSVTVVMTSNATCATGNPATSNAIVTTVNPNLPVIANIVASAVTICTGASVTFTATPTNGGTTPAYQWQVNNVNAGTNSATFTTTTIANNDLVKVILTSNATPCATGNPAASNTITMTVNPVLIPSVSITSTSTSICSNAGTSVTFNATPINGGTVPVYQWRRNGIIIAGATSSTYTTTSLASPSTITVVMTSNATCASPLNATSNSVVMTVFPGVPDVGNGNNANNAPSGPVSVCPPASGLIYNIPTNMSNGETYVWTVPTGFTITSGAGTSQITVSVATNATIGTNNISVTAFSPCGNSGTSKNLNINVNSFNGVTVPSATQSVCSNGAILVIGTLTGNATSGTWTAPTGAFSNPITSVTNPIVVSATYTPAITSGNVLLTITTNTPSGGGCPNVAGAAQIALTVNQIVAITAQPATPQTLCSGSSASFSVSATGTGLTYQWQKGGTNLINGSTISGATSSTLTLTNIVTSDAANYTVVVSGAAPCSSVTSNVSVLVVNQIVAITTQPATTQSICSGSSVSFNVAATGTGLNYQWRKGITNLADGGAISGSNAATLTINPTVTADAAADYNVIITGTAPCNPVTSNNAALVVNQIVAITSQPAITQTLCSGSIATFIVTATGTGLTYQWKKGATNLINGGTISGATSSTLTLTNIATSDAANYTVVVSGAVPCPAVTSNISALLVNQIVAITTQPATTQSICSGSSVSFNVVATGTGLNYQWRKGITNLADGGAISGSNAATLTINPTVTADAALDYNVVITGTAPCNPMTSNNAALVVNQVIAITAQPVTIQTLCSGSTATFSVSATGTGITFQWQKGGTNLVNGGTISGATSSTLTLTNSATSDAANYTVVVSGATPCSAITSNVSALLVNQIVAITTQPATTQIVCSGTSTSFNVVATGTGLSYQWRKGATNIANGGTVSGATTATLIINPTVTSDAAADYNVIITGVTPCNPVTSNNAALVVNQAIAITAQPAATQTLCSGSTVTFSVTATGNGLSYQWKKGATNIIDGGAISGATSATLTLSNSTTSDAANYTVVVSGAAPCSAVTSNVSVLLVNQIIAITTQPATNQTVCSGSSASFNVVATGAGLTYQWRKGITNLADGGTISGSTTATLTINPTFAGDTATDYNVVITGTSPCNPLTSNNAALVVNQVVAISAQPALTQTLCSGNTASFSVTASGAGLNYQWRRGTTNLVNGGTVAGATSSTLTLSNLQTTDAATNYNVVITGTSPCTSLTSNNSILIINRLVAINTQPSNVGVCASNPATLGLVASGDGLTYQWYKGTIGSGIAVVNSANITGANSAILNFVQAALTDDGPYYSIVSGIAPCAIVTSNQVTLNVDQSIAIMSQPITQTVCENTTNVNFAVVANAGGDPLTYQWRKNGLNLSGATATTFTIAPVTSAAAGNYDVVISGPSGYTCASTQSAIATLIVTQIPTVSISYVGTPFCKSIITAQPVTRSGTNAFVGGNYSYSVVSGGPTLSLDTTSGTIIPSTSNAGTYTVTYTTPTTGICAPVSTTTSVTITPIPTASISYTGNPFCNSINVAQAVNLGGTNAFTGGTFSAAAGLSINATNGAITPSTSTAGTYTITYIIPSTAGCAAVSTTTTITITPTPTASINYAGTPFCNSISGAQAVNLIGTNAFLGGIFSAAAGLTINSTTGAIIPNTSTAGTYTITYTGPTTGGCAPVSTTTSVTITPIPTASISYTGNPFCNSISSTRAVSLSGTNAFSGGIFSAAAGLSINATNGAITPNTSTPSTYIVTYTIPATSGCAVVIATTTVIINPLLVATFNYNSPAFCKSATNPLLTFTGGGVAGVFSSSPPGLSINGTTGAINLAISTIGTYTVTNTIAASGGCSAVVHSQSLTIHPVSTGGSITGFFSATPTVISNLITACHLGSGTLNLSGFIGNILRWEFSTNGGVIWLPITNISNTNNFTNISLTTIYRAVVQSGTCGIAYSAIAFVNVIPPNIKPSPVSASPSTLCLGSSSLFSSQSSYGTGQFLQGGDFQTGQLNTQDPRGWLVDGSPGGYTASANNTKSNNWSGTNPQPFPGGIIYDSGDPKFAIANGPLTTTLQTPIFNSLGLTTFSFGFDQAYNLLNGDRIIVELSLDGGASYNVTLQNITGPVQSTLINTFANDNTSFDLQNYIGQAQLRVRFTFIGANLSSAWALDNFKFPDAPLGQTIEWTNEAGVIISTTNTASITPVSPGVQVYGVTSLINGCRSSGILGTEFVTVNVNFAYAGKDLAIAAADCGNNTVTLNSYDNRLTAAQNIAKGAWDNNYLTSTASGTGATGKWTIKSSTAISPCNVATFLPNDTDPNARFSGDGGTYVLTWTSAGCSDDVTVLLTNCSTINFDGTNDNITFADNYDFTAPFSVEVWIKPNSITGTQTIFSKRDSNNLTTGYDLKLTGDKISFNWNGAGTIVSNHAISTNRWFHIAITISGATYRLYIDGIEVKNASGTMPVVNDFDCILGAMNKSGSQPISYFNGWMDELRIWNKTLTPEQLRQTMNQEIKSNGAAVAGVVVPVNVNGLLWTTDLLGYYQMSSISCGYLNPTKGTALGKLRNITSTQEQTAPIPYTSRIDGQDWSNKTTWTHFNVWDAPNSLGVDNSTPIDWNIVQISHNINSGNKDITLLGLLSTTGKLTMADPIVTTPIEKNDGQGLWITLYLLLNGNIDLVGESQLVQKRYTSSQFDDSILDENSSGYIERDQQGQKNSYNYNYWSSPVSIQGGLNNSPYAIANILKDGTNSLSPGTINFNNDPFFADTMFSTPIKISNRWIWSYNSQTLNSNTELNNYYQWKYVGNTGLIKAGEGYTMKGTGGIAVMTAVQNYVYVGKPNSGTITLVLPYDQTYLIGNPYPSALDADKFIKDNLKDCPGCTNTMNAFSGALYFWDHFGLSNNHILTQYEGGYATYTLMGGVKGVAASTLTATGSGTKVPGRYIPVAQGFFVDASPNPGLTNPPLPTVVQGGTLFFDNSQRVFEREIPGNSVFMKTSGSALSSPKNGDEAKEKRSKIRLGFDSSLGAHRQLLLGADSNATQMFDIGYDARMFDLSIDDMFWEINNIEYVIQAVTDFNENQNIPFGLTIGNKGNLTIKIDAVENISATTEIYIHDNVTGIYHSIRNKDFTISLAVGEYRNRFSLQFTNKTLNVATTEYNDGLIVLYSTNLKVLLIQNEALLATVNEVRLFNLLGQAVANWDVKNENQTRIQIPIKNLSEGVYIVKLKTSKGDYSKKIIIK